MERDYDSEEIIQILWNICQEFKEGTDITTDYLEYISALLYITYFNNQDNLKTLFNRKRNYYIADDIDTYISNIQNENKDLFSNITFKNIRIRRNVGEENILGKTIENLYSLIANLEKKHKTSKKYIAEAYEKIIFRAISNNEVSPRRGEFYTPTTIAKIMAEITMVIDKVEICDPFCGSGNIILNLPIGEETKIFGKEKNLSIYNLCMTNLFLHDINNNNIILEDNDIEKDKMQKYDYIISNPPFMDRNTRNKNLYDDNFGAPGDYAHVVKMFESLKDYGKMSVILPHGVLFRESEKNIRKEFIENNYIEAIIGLPENMFLGTRNSVIVMVLRKNKRNNTDILFIDASNEFESEKKINILTKTNQEKIINTYFRREEIKGYSHLASLSEICENDYNLTIKRYVTKEVKKKNIRKEDIMEDLKILEKERDILEDNIKDVLKRLEVAEVFEICTRNNNVDEVNYVILAQRIREALESKKCSRYRLCNDLNISPGVLIHAERGTGSIRLETLVKICKYLDVSIEDMLKS